ncbi:MAG: RuBisCO large subunit C-terminal-like domain-containing protein [Acidobacteria bacterium]|jgi:ribulose-bisphosphate carboxylase large chain|nr:RuBisCO large subunit C-terminal-like domain-containing protein [Acidobacteriota bacterium]
MKDYNGFKVSIDLSGERFRVVYRLQGSKDEAYQKARDICVEQTIEFPDDLVTGGDIREHILGRIESFQPSEPGDMAIDPGQTHMAGLWETSISYAIETTGFELTQLINVIFGNFSLKPGVRVERLELPESLLKTFKGPRFGIQGLRSLIGVPERPLLCTALKPMGLPVEILADLAYRFALGGVDFIKDDHGLADQPFAPFYKRAEQCAAAVAKANRETGGKCLYFPNLSAAAEHIFTKAKFAKESGAGGLMVAPGLIGLDTMRCLAEDDRIGLPIISHPAFQGSFVTCRDSGVSHHVIFGQLPRLAGADAGIFPNYGGRFSFSKKDCCSIVQGSTAFMHHLKPIFSLPGGGMSLERIPEMVETYGKDVVFLIGGALHKMGPDLVENCRRYMKVLCSR